MHHFCMKLSKIILGRGNTTPHTFSSPSILNSWICRWSNVKFVRDIVPCLAL